MCLGRKMARIWDRKLKQEINKISNLLQFIHKQEIVYIIQVFLIENSYFGIVLFLTEHLQAKRHLKGC